MTRSSDAVEKIAEDAIGLFLEYRDKHGHTEESAKWAAIREFSDAEHYDASQSEKPPVITAKVPAGYRMVPETPTMKMMDEALCVRPYERNTKHDMLKIWQAMLAAAPLPDGNNSGSGGKR